MINILSKETIDKIAAGEVAERPESVVKELLDNAIDAGADTISIEVRNGGLDLIRVTDNGSGIEQGDVRNAFLRHATSKLKDAEDIEHIRSMGFRGEALASIAAVSEVELITRHKTELTGTQYRIDGGVEQSFKEIGVPQGTSVIVRNFLMNVPVRRQFLKSVQTETSYIVNIVEKAALAYTFIAFSLKSDGKTLFSSTGNGRLKDVIYQIYGREAAASLLEVDSDVLAENYADISRNIHVTGYAARPVIARSRRDYEVFIVNGRWIQSDILKKAAEDAYAPYMMQHKYPMFVLHIELEPESVDVNVHPRKSEVRFSSNKFVYDAVYNVLTKVLHEAELIVDAGKAHFLREDSRKSAQSIAKANAPEAFETKRQYDYVSSIGEEIPNGVADGRNETSAAQSRKVFINKDNAPYFRLIGQVFETYWIIEYNDEMYIIDQHAAHEKVNFEYYMSLIHAHKVESQMIFPPIVLSLSAREAVLFDKFADDFNALGYEIEYAGDRDYIVRAVPSNLPQLADEEVLHSLIDGMFEENRSLSSELIHDKIASMSCKAAIKGNMRISEAEMRELIGKLLTLENPYACPHGRPTIVKWTRSDLDKLFKRIVS